MGEYGVGVSLLLLFRWDCVCKVPEEWLELQLSPVLTVFVSGRSGESGKKELRTRSVTTGAVPFTNLLFTTRPCIYSAPVLNISNWP